VLIGRFVQLEPLSIDHVDEIAAAVGDDRSTYQWAPVPKDYADAVATVQTRLQQLDSGSWMPFVQRRLADRAVVGMTNFLNIERWNGADANPTSVEIGGTWLNPSAQRSAINTEAKLLLFAVAFETWNVVRVQIKTDARNQRSRAAISRLGAQFEGVLRNFQAGNGDLGEGSPRDTAMFSVLANEWPTVRERLEFSLNQVF
jgi:N-acetyltransferase